MNGSNKKAREFLNDGETRDSDVVNRLHSNSRSGGNLSAIAIYQQPKLSGVYDKNACMVTFHKSRVRNWYPSPGARGFWYSLGVHEPMRALQSVELAILFVFSAALFIGLLFSVWPEGSAPWWQKLIKGYGVYAVLGAVISLAIVIPNAEQRKGLLVALVFFLLCWLVFLLGQHFSLFRDQ